MKICTKCKETKELSKFGNSKVGKGGLRARCKVCRKADNKAWREANKERVKANKKTWQQANKEKVRANQKTWQQANPDKQRASVKAWYEANKEQEKVKSKAWKQANPDKCNTYNAKRRSAKLQRTPSWLTTDDWNKINYMYSLAAFMTQQTGIKHHVDHIIPLQGCTVSGLHTPNNLQILTASENSSKGNRY